MQGFSGKLTTYDFLGMLIPGVVVMYCICWTCFPDVLIETVVRYSCSCKLSVGDSQTAIAQVCGVVIFLTVSYMAGLMVNCMSDLMFGKFRNNERNLRLAVLQYHRRRFDTKKDYKRAKLRNPLRFLTQIFGCRSKAYSIAEKNYYQYYYWLLNAGKLSGTIPVMEAQIAFVRNMFLPTILMAFIPPLEAHNMPLKTRIITVLMFVIFCLGELYVMYTRQMRVYYIIIEDYCEYKLMNENDKRNNNITD